MNRLIRWLSVLILLVAGFWRFHLLESQSLWHDEGNSLRLAERSIPALIEASSHDIHPPGYYIGLKWWMFLAGKTEFGLRSFSAFWGLLGVAGTYALGRRLYGPLAASIAAALVAANPFAVYYSQETRMYSQLGALSVLSFWVLVKMLHASDHHRAENRPNQFAFHIAPWAIWLMIINTVGLYTHYTYPFTMIAQGVVFLWWWIPRRDPRARNVYIVLNVITLMFFQSWLPTAYKQITSWPQTGDQTALLDRADRVFTLLIYGQTATHLSALAYVVPIGLLVLGVLLPDRRAGAERPSVLWRVSLPLIWSGLSIGALLLSGAYREANLKFLVPAQMSIALMLGRSLERIGAVLSGVVRPPQSLLMRWSSAAALSILVIIPNIHNLGPMYHDEQYARSDYRQIAELLTQDARDGDAIILNAPNQIEAFDYYYHGVSPVYGLPKGLGGDNAATEQATADLIAQYKRIFVVLWGQSERDPNGVVESTLDAGAYVIGRQWITDVELVQYAVLDAPPTEASQVVKMAFGDHIILVGYALSTDGTDQQILPGDVLGVTLFWQTNTLLDKRYKVTVQLLNPDGTLASQHDSEPANGRAITTTWQAGQTITDNHGLVVKQDAITGTYSLIVAVYELDPPNTRLIPDQPDANNAYRLTTLTLE
ncbi:MAG: glycosyltransferase family 39 protein [Chloroflexi bacterium]|nr:glycosyltransferase family 39 protein [Chloroflexota bacterium]